MTESENQKIDAEIAKLIAERSKLSKKSVKLSKEIFWYPIALATALVLAIGTVVKFVL